MKKIDDNVVLVMISRRQAGEILGLSTRTLKRMEERGVLHAYRLNARVVRYRRDEVLELLNKSQDLV